MTSLEGYHVLHLGSQIFLERIDQPTQNPEGWHVKYDENSKPLYWENGLERQSLQHIAVERLQPAITDWSGWQTKFDMNGNPLYMYKGEERRPFSEFGCFGKEGVTLKDIEKIEKDRKAKERDWEGWHVKFDEKGNGMYFYKGEETRPPGGGCGNMGVTSCK